MKKIRQLAGLYLLALGLFAASCTEEVEPSYVNSDQDFVSYAAHSSIFKAQAGRLATQVASTGEIKALGEEFFTYYSKSSDELNKLGQENGFKVPVSQSDENQRLYNELDRLWGKDFESLYITEIRELYNKDIKWFEEAARDVKSAELKAWINKHLPVLRNQQNAIQQLATNRESL